MDVDGISNDDACMGTFPLLKGMGVRLIRRRIDPTMSLPSF
jgi:hypothetical protein